MISKRPHNLTQPEHSRDKSIRDVLRDLDGDPTLVQRRTYVKNLEDRSHQYEQTGLCIVPAGTYSFEKSSSLFSANNPPSPESESELVGTTIITVQLPVAYKPFRKEDVWVRVYLKIVHDSPLQS